MDLALFRPWIVFLHVVSVLGLLAIHGISIGVVFKVRGERDPLRIRTLLELSNAYLNAFYGFLMLVLATGILAGVAGGWWTSGRLWIWAALGVLIGIVIAMYVLASSYFETLRHAVGIATFQDVRKGLAAPQPAAPAELERLLASRRAEQIAAVGFGGVAALVWLMILKPF